MALINPNHQTTLCSKLISIDVVDYIGTVSTFRFDKSQKVDRILHEYPLESIVLKLQSRCVVMRFIDLQKTVILIADLSCSRTHFLCEYSS